MNRAVARLTRIGFVSLLVLCLGPAPVFAADTGAGGDAQARAQASLDKAVEFLKSRGIGRPIDTAVVLGTGLGQLTEAVVDPVAVAYSEIPGFPRTGVSGHEGQLIAGALEGSRVEVKMTLTAPGCHLGGQIAGDVQSKLLALEQVEEANVELVWDQPWHQSMISAEGRRKLGLDSV